ncbi:MAG TPA: UDP-N-acetylglucosamine 1-carboxyvinyltransferase, partial [bacterium]|nr:UDP-N-acetylglucosamine 1-carboxyvinyltransferase [bacterium]
LQGEVPMAGSKNAALPILAATICAPGRYTLHNLPDLLDVHVFLQVLEALGATVSPLANGTATVDTSGIRCADPQPPKDLVSKMRASVLVMGPLLGRCGRAEVTMPGGCSLGARPINYHLAGFEAMGAQLVPHNGTIMVDAARGLHGADIDLPFASVGATENLLMAAVLAQGETVIRNAAREPEVTDLGEFLVAMGAHIDGLGERDIRIHGGAPLHPVEYTVIPDRIEAGSYLCALANTGGSGRITRCRPEHFTELLRVLEEAGCRLTVGDTWVELQAPPTLGAVGLCTGPYPAFATDHQPLWMSCLTTAHAPLGFEIILETLFESRFNQVAPLKELGADIEVLSQVACVRPVSTLRPGTIAATDIRGGMGLVVAALRIPGTTRITQLHHLQRGYSQLTEKLEALGATARYCSNCDSPAPIAAVAG